MSTAENGRTIEQWDRFRIESKTPGYFEEKYGDPNPIYEVEGLDVDVFGKSWGMMDGNPACLLYAIRAAGTTPFGGNVYYGKIGCLGEVIHECELGERIEDEVEASAD